jgi:DNA-3-methyladenine glycosylase II
VWGADLAADDALAAALQAGARHLAAVDPVLGQLVERFGAPTLNVDRRLFRTLVMAIVSQQLSSAGAAAIMRRVEALFPADAPVDPTLLATLPPDVLRGAGLSNAKVASLHDLAAHLLDGRLDLPRLEALGDDEVVAQLVAVRGIGRWTAEMFLIFSLGRLDVLPVDDYSVRNAVKRAYDLPTLPARKELLARGAPWRPYCTVASLLLWKVQERAPGR